MNRREFKRKAKVFIQKGVKAISHMEHLVDVLENPTKIGVIVSAARFVTALGEEFDSNPWHRYDGWTRVRDVPVLHSIVAMLVQEKRVAQVGPRDGDQRCYEGTFAGYTCGFHMSGTWTDGPFVLIDDELEHERIIKAMSEAVWEILGDRICMAPLEKGWGWEFTRDPLTTSAPSAASEAIWDEVERMHKHDINRAILLYGESGTGKSYIIRDVIHRAGGRSLRIEFDMVNYLKDVDELIRFLQPSALAIDDLDHSSNQSSIFNKFERIKAVCKLMLVSVNDIEKLNPASLRPGRFDRLIEINRLDEGVYDRMLAGIQLTEEQSARVREMPAAYISEFVTLANICGTDIAIEALSELELRRNHIRLLIEGDDEDECSEPELGDGER